MGDLPHGTGAGCNDLWQIMVPRSLGYTSLRLRAGVMSRLDRRLLRANALLQVPYLNLRYRAIGLSDRVMYSRAENTATFSLASGEQFRIVGRRRLWVYADGVDARTRRLAHEYGLEHMVLPHRPTVVDVGAHVGEFRRAVSMTLAGRGSELGKYLAFEPDPDARRTLLRSFPATMCLCCALGAGSGEAQFILDSDNADSRLAAVDDVAQDARGVQVRTLDDALDESDVGQIDLLKVEAEGSEPEVIAGAAVSLRRCVWVAVDAGPERSRHVTTVASLNPLLDAGFELVWHSYPRNVFVLRNSNLPAPQPGTGG